MKIFLTMVLIMFASETMTAQWSQSGPAEVQVLSLAVSANGTMYAGTRDNRTSNNGFGVYRSSDNGAIWTAVNTGLPLSQSMNGIVWNIACKNDTVFLYHALNNGDTPKLYRSVNAGDNWSVVTTPMNLSRIITTTNAVLIGNGNAVYRSLDGGQSWTLSKATAKFYTLLRAGNKLFLTGDSLYMSADEGATWTVQIKYTAISSPLIWSNGTTMFGSYVTNDQLSRSTDDGKTWTALTNPAGYPRAVYFTGAKTFLATDIGSTTDLVFSSADNGATWDTVKYLSRFTEPYIHSFLVKGSDLYAGYGKIGVIRSTDGGTSWSVSSKGMPPRHFIYQMMKNGSEWYMGVMRFGFYKSIDNGTTWQQSTKGMTNNIDVTGLAMSGDTIIAGTKSSGYYRSIDKGESWTKIGTSSTASSAVVVWNNKLYSAAGGVAVSTNGGMTWTDMNKGLLVPCIGMKVVNDRLFYYTQSWGLWTWTDTSTTWVQVGKDSIGVSACVNNVVTVNGRIYISTGLNNAAGAVLYSDNNGLSWKKTAVLPYAAAGVLAQGAVYIHAFGNVLIAAVGGQFKASALYSSTNGGDSWGDITGNFPATSGPLMVRNMYQLNNELFIPLNSYSGLGYSLYRGTLNTLSSGRTADGAPAGYYLDQNYPNPFNPSTTIQYALPKAGNVILKVYDVVGKEVATLVNAHHEIGRYTVDFDASTLASGIYIYKLTSGSFAEIKRMMLVK